MEPSTKTMKCPYCAEEIPTENGVCPYCDRDVTIDPQQIPIQGSAQSEKKKGRGLGKKLVILVIVGAIVVFIYTQIGLYTVQPIGALPEGATMLVWRSSGEPFFNSPDALCLKVQGEVSLLCRGMAIGQAPIDRIILRLPYMDWAYLASTGGRSFDG